MVQFGNTHWYRPGDVVLIWRDTLELDNGNVELIGSEVLRSSCRLSFQFQIANSHSGG